ncbi:hypothetical protein NP493_15g00000 [Ridgeia piscesae]|uniref:Secreted protein n=1 Tax=Ridgeia piscesae TaxID=27915 RepID=A0AAD9PEG7_RIDPI|nr:hypothetical protein NP493_15g00000 [Ridgeia piscesae]
MTSCVAVLVAVSLVWMGAIQALSIKEVVDQRAELEKVDMSATWTAPYAGVDEVYSAYVARQRQVNAAMDVNNNRGHVCRPSHCIHLTPLTVLAILT